MTGNRPLLKVARPRCRAGGRVPRSSAIPQHQHSIKGSAVGEPAGFGPRPAIQHQGSGPPHRPVMVLEHTPGHHVLVWNTPPLQQAPSPPRGQNRTCRDWKPVLVCRCMLRSVSLWKTHSCPYALSAQPWMCHVTTRFIPHCCHANSYSEAVVPVYWRDVIFAHHRAAGRSALGSQSLRFLSGDTTNTSALKENAFSLTRFCCIYEHTCWVSLNSFFYSLVQNASCVL